MLRELWEKTLVGMSTEPPQEPEKKLFVPKNLEVPRLPTYEKKAPLWYWDLFPENAVKSTKSKIDGDKLRAMAIEHGYSDIQQLDKIIGWIKNGAKIGCHGQYREPTKAKNAKGCAEDGHKISDAIASWIKKGIHLFHF